ncbi:MAG: hypothetical protein SF052_09405 [Bacteroidia bacterium]|nr:hypothetical protein [Bacteroidia bacterium]
MNSPFKFLDSYSREDKAIFFGREAEVEALYEKLFETNLILLYGASGTGKTSLINCGLSNKFQDTDWFAMFVRRGDHLLSSFHREIRRRSITPIPENAALIPALKSLYYDHYKPIYLIFDQFEELFILGSEEEQREFLGELSQLLTINMQVTVILSMREEYLASLSDYEKTLPFLFDNRLRLEKMSRANLKKVITGTASAFSITLDPPETTLEEMMVKLGNKKAGVDLTHLQVYLDRLYRKYTGIHGEGEKVVFDPSLIEKTGEIGDVLAEYLDEQIKSLGREAGNAEIPLAILYTLVTDDGTKRNLNTLEILALLPSDMSISPDSLGFCLRRLEGMRILKPVGEDTQSLKYELTHDSLAVRIEERVSDEQKIRRKMSRFLQEQYSRYESSQVLMNRDDLEYIRPYLSSLTLNGPAKEFVRKSEASVKRKGQILAGIVTVIVLIISALGIRAYIEGQRYEAQYLNARARQISGTDPTVALRLEEAAYAIDADAAIRQDMFFTYRKNVFYQSLLKLDGPVIAAARSEDGGELITVTTSQNEPQLWNATGQNAGTLTGHIHPVYDVAFAASGHIASAGNDKTAIRWEKSGKQRDVFMSAEAEQAPDIRSVAISPEGNWVLTGASDGKAVLWFAGKKQPIFEYAIDSEIKDVAIHPEATSFAVAGNTEILFYAVFADSAWKIQTVKTPGEGLRSVAYSPDGKYLSGGDQSGKIFLWERSSDSLQLIRQTAAHRGAVHTLAFSPDSRWLVSGSADSTAAVASLTQDNFLRLRGHSGEVRSVNIGKDQVVMTAAMDSTVRLWKLPSPAPFYESEAHGRGVSALAFSPDGKKIATGGKDQMVNLTDLVTGQFIEAHARHREDILTVKIFPDGKIGSVDAFGGVVIMDAENKTLIRTFQARDTELLSAAFSNDGQWLLTGGSDSTARLWKMETGEEQLRLPHKGVVFSVVFSPDDRSMLTGCEDSVAYLWDRAGKLLQTFTGHQGEVLTVGFTPQTGQILTGSQDQTARIWDKKGKLLQVFRDLPKPVSSVAINPSETLLLVSYKDSRVILFDREGYAISDITEHKGIVNTVIFSPDGKYLATGSDDKYLRVWQDFRLPLADFLKKGFLNPLNAQSRRQYDIK